MYLKDLMRPKVRMHGTAYKYLDATCRNLLRLSVPLFIYLRAQSWGTKLTLVEKNKIRQRRHYCELGVVARPNNLSKHSLLRDAAILFNQSEHLLHAALTAVNLLCCGT